MIPWLKGLLMDQSAFERIGRMLLFGLGQAIQSGIVPTGIDGGGKVIGFVLSMLPFLIGAGKVEPVPPKP